MAYRVRLLPKAEGDLEELYLWVVERAPLRGPLWFNRLEEAILSLRENPKRCPTVPQLSSSTDSVRQLLFGKKPNLYRVFFRIKDDLVEILHIRRGARKLRFRGELEP